MREQPEKRRGAHDQHAGDPKPVFAEGRHAAAVLCVSKPAFDVFLHRFFRVG